MTLSQSGKKKTNKKNERERERERRGRKEEKRKESKKRRERNVSTSISALSFLCPRLRGTIINNLRACISIFSERPARPRSAVSFLCPDAVYSLGTAATRGATTRTVTGNDGETEELKLLNVCRRASLFVPAQTHDTEIFISPPIILPVLFAFDDTAPRWNLQRELDVIKESFIPRARARASPYGKRRPGAYTPAICACTLVYDANAFDGPARIARQRFGSPPTTGAPATTTLILALSCIS